MKWFDSALLDSYQAYQTTFGGSDGFCKCDSPYVGVPPNCSYACGKNNFAQSTGMSADDCDKCPQGVDCSRDQQEVQTLPLKPNYWRISYHSTKVYRCPIDGACVGGPITGIRGAGYCAENHEGEGI
jgi:hypothetical protein